MYSIKRSKKRKSEPTYGYIIPLPGGNPSISENEDPTEVRCSRVGRIANRVHGVPQGGVLGRDVLNKTELCNEGRTL